MHESNIELLREESRRLLQVEIDLLQRMKDAKGVVVDEKADEHQTFSSASIDKDLKMLRGEASKLERLEMVLAVVGTMKAGKSTTINAIVGTEVLPNRNRPMTALPTRIRHTPGQKEPVLLLENNDPINALVVQLHKVLAQKLDELLSQVDALKVRIDAIPSLLKSFRQSLLVAAVSGRLTEGWRKQNQSTETGEDVIKNDQLAKLALLEEYPELKKKKSSIQSDIDENYLFEIPESWCFTTWGKVSEWITYGFTRPMPKSESGKKLLTAKDVQRFELELIDCGLTTVEAFEALSDKDKPIKGDLLITKDGSIGRAALVKTEEDFCINQSVAVCWLRSTTMNKRYLELLSNSDFTQRFVKDKAQGMAIQHLSIIDFAKCPLPVPSNTEQDEIVRYIEEIFTFADKLETTVASAKSRIDLLTQSILTKAFRGELVPQDPSDEPASVLLERIKAQRAAEPKAKRGRKVVAKAD